MLKIYLIFVKYEKIVVTSIILLSVICLLQRETIIKSTESKPKDERNYLVNKKGCQIVDMPPTTSKFFKIPSPMKCKYKTIRTPLVSSDDTSIWVNEEALKSNGFEDNTNIMCCYYELNLPIDFRGCNERYKYSKVCIPFWNRTKVTAEYLKVYCIKDNKLVYIDFHLFVPEKKYVDVRCKTLSKSKDRLNILILGFDALSRAHFHRTMRNTAEFLIKNLSAIEMMGYNKVASSTYPNVLAATSGQHWEELRETCSLRNTYLDPCKFIWDDYTLAGYRTALTEEMGYSFTLRPDRPGFCKQPTDYHSSHLLKAAIKDNAQARIGKYCLGVRFRYEAFLTYVDRFIRSSTKYPYFGFFFQDSYTHEGLNNGHLIDDGYCDYLKEKSRNNSFNKTVLIFLSDHGYLKNPGYFVTDSAQLEAKLPFLFLVFPPWFEQKYSTAIRNMKENTRSLTTPFDFYETLKDLIDYPDKLNDSALEKRNSILSIDPLPRRISLFLRIPKRRNCIDAGIPWNYCACLQDTKEDVRSPIIQYLCQQVIYYINAQIEPYPQCAKLTLQKIISGAVSRSIIGSARTNGSFGHRVTFVTTPGSGIFMATALDVVNKFNARENNSFDFIEAVSRLDVYKHKSACVDEYKVQRFCHCN